MKGKLFILLCLTSVLIITACVFVIEPEEMRKWYAETVTLDKTDLILNMHKGTIALNGSFYDYSTAILTANFLPVKSTFRNATWTSSHSNIVRVRAIDTETEFGVLKAELTALEVSTETVTITLRVEDENGILRQRAVCEVVVLNEAPVLAEDVSLRSYKNILYLDGKFNQQVLSPVFDPGAVIYDDVSWRSVLVDFDGNIILDNDNKEIDGSFIASVEKNRRVEDVKIGNNDVKRTVANNAVVKAVSPGTTGIIVTTTGSALLSWEPPVNEGDFEVIGYEVSIRRPGDTSITWISVGDETSFTFYNILFDAEYIYRVRALNQTGYGMSAAFPSNELNTPAAGPGTPSAPDNLEVNFEGFHTYTCVVTVSPQTAQFESIAEFLDSGYYRSFDPDFDFGSAPNGDSNSNRANWSAAGGNHDSPDFVIHFDDFDRNLFGKAGSKNLVPDPIEYLKDEYNDYIKIPEIQPGPYRSHSQFNYFSLAHFAFTGYRQGFPWGIKADEDGTTRAGQTWSTGIEVFAANTQSAVQFSGIGVDLGEDKFFDTVIIYAGGNISLPSALNYRKDINVQCPGITLEYMPNSTAAVATFDRLYKANLSMLSRINWNDPASQNNWPVPGYINSPWRYGGKIEPDGESWVYVFHFEESVRARFLRVNFEQGIVSPPASGFLGRVFVNSFEVYNTKDTND